MNKEKLNKETFLLLGSVLTSLQTAVQILDSFQIANDESMPEALVRVAGHSGAAADLLANLLSQAAGDGSQNAEAYLISFFATLDNERADHGKIESYPESLVN